MRSCRVGERLQKIAVEFDRDECAVAIEQRKRQCALAGANLDDAIARSRIDRKDDPVDDAPIVKEVLSEMFLGAMHGLQRRQCPCLHDMKLWPDLRD